MNKLGVIFKQTSWQVIGKIVTSVSTFIILGIVARNYQESGIGIFTLALTYLTMFNLLGDFGLNAHVLSSAQGKWDKLQSGWNKLLGTRVLWSIFLAVLAIALLPFWPFTTSEFSKAIIFGSLAIVGSGIYLTCNLIFQSKLRYDFSVLASGLGTLVGLTVYIYLVFLDVPIYLLLIANTLSWVVIAVASLLLVKKFFKNLSPVFNFPFVKSLFKDSWAIAVTLALNVVYFRIDSFMIAYFKGVSDAGIYNIAYLVFQSVLVLPTFIMNSYYPLMLKSLREIRFVGFSLLILAFLGTLSTFIFAPAVIKIITGGAGFKGSIQSLQILSLGFPAYFLSSLLMWIMVVCGKYKLMLTIYGLGLLLNLVLNFLYIPEYSFLAASFTTVVCEYLILIMQIFFFKGIILR